MQQGMYTPKGTFIYMNIFFQNQFSECDLLCIVQENVLLFMYSILSFYGIW